MKAQNPLWNRMGITVGLLCLGSMLAILPLGVSAVRAGDGAETLMSVDPLLASQQRENATAAAVIPGAGVEESIKRGPANRDVEPEVIVLNTRGYKYGPPPTIDPAAQNRASQTP
jgi:hypothetical protein